MHTDGPQFEKILLLKNDAKLVINGKTRARFTFFKNFLWRLCYRSLSQNDLNCFRNRLETCGFAERKLFYISNPERFFSSLKKTIIRYLVKKSEAFMLIFTSGRRRVFFKNRFFTSALWTIHLILNLQPRYYRNVNYYTIYTCSFIQYYFSMLRNN